MYSQEPSIPVSSIEDSKNPDMNLTANQREFLNAMTKIKVKMINYVVSLH